MTGSVLGIDLGGTKIAIAGKRGREVGESRVEGTDLDSAESLIEQIVGLVGEERDEDLAGVGIGVPSIIEFDSGRVVSSVNIPLADVPLRETLGERVGVPVFLDNDATVAALAESHDDELRQAVRDLVMLTIGTGVGGGLVLGGRIYRGASGAAGELGHTIVGMDLASTVPRPMKFPQPGSLEFVASGHALDRLAQQAAKLHGDSELARLASEDKPVLGADAVEAARGGDLAAARIVEIWGQRVGIGVANAINTFDPEEVVIGGGAAQAGEMLLEPARRVAGDYVVAGLGKNTNIRLARHGIRAGVIGAALLAEHELEDETQASAGDSGRASAEASR